MTIESNSSTTVSARGVLLDIEGTTSSIRFVYDEMFPYVRQHLASFLKREWESEDVQSCLPLLANDLGHESLAQWIRADEEAEVQQSLVTAGVIQLMDGDVKATGLKQLQGLIWKDGFHSGQLVAHLYNDVAPAIRNWKEAGQDIRIYSSGSIAAQKLFFGHSVAGDLLHLFSSHYDTTTGSKKEAESYRKIAGDFDLPPSDILFISDVAEELQAACTAGMQTLLSIRPGNKPQGENHNFRTITQFTEIEISDSVTD